MNKYKLCIYMDSKKNKILKFIKAISYLNYNFLNLMIEPFNYFKNDRIYF